jgi:hypothetical protein
VRVKTLSGIAEPRVFHAPALIGYDDAEPVNAALVPFFGHQTTNVSSEKAVMVVSIVDRNAFKLAA